MTHGGWAVKVLREKESAFWTQDQKKLWERKSIICGWVMI